MYQLLFMFGHCLVQYGFIQVCILYRFFWETSLLYFCFFALRRIRCNLHTFYNICTIIQSRRERGGSGRGELSPTPPPFPEAKIYVRR